MFKVLDANVELCQLASSGQMWCSVLVNIKTVSIKAVLTNVWNNFKLNESWFLPIQWSFIWTYYKLCIS